MGVYGFWYDDAWLKIGKVGPNSKNRYTYQHYNLGSARSTFPGSLMGDSKMAPIVGSDRSSINAWIRTSTCRVNILLPAKRQPELLSLLEAFLHLRLRPRYEGQSRVPRQAGILRFVLGSQPEVEQAIDGLTRMTSLTRRSFSLLMLRRIMEVTPSPVAEWAMTFSGHGRCTGLTSDAASTHRSPRIALHYLDEELTLDRSARYFESRTCRGCAPLFRRLRGGPSDSGGEGGTRRFASPSIRKSLH